jgi:hypothetical protein
MPQFSAFDLSASRVLVECVLLYRREMFYIRVLFYYFVFVLLIPHIYFLFFMYWVPLNNCPDSEDVMMCFFFFLFCHVLLYRLSTLPISSRLI